MTKVILRAEGMIKSIIKPS